MGGRSGGLARNGGGDRDLRRAAALLRPPVAPPQQLPIRLLVPLGRGRRWVGAAPVPAGAAPPSSDEN